jgi:nicotinate phosphoribosyltransferase
MVRSHEAPADPGQSALLTDLYELTMLAVYHEHRMVHEAVFEFFVRRLPEQRSFLIAAGLEQAVDFLEQLAFTPSELDWLASTGRYADTFLDSLAGFRFTGDVHAMPEGSVFFADEPILRVTAPMPQAQLVESRLVNLLQFQTLVASKAARCVLAAPGRTLVDFGLRRAHGAEAGLLAARASFIAGFTGTATVLAERRFGIPCFGTMAHSFVQAHDDEVEAFTHFARTQKRNVVLLIDTYDTVAGARRVVELDRTLSAEGIRVDAVRLDSGDLVSLSHEVRAVLDRGGCEHVRIFASGGLDEDVLARLIGAGAPIDGFGIGTSLDVSADAPYLDCVYKLQEYAGRARRKRSTAKATWPGRKQVYREYDASGTMCRDTVTVEDDARDGEPLIVKVMDNGRRIARPPTLEQVREHTAQSLARLPPALRQLEPSPPYPVTISDAMRRLTEAVDAEFG